MHSIDDMKTTPWRFYWSWYIFSIFSIRFFQVDEDPNGRSPIIDSFGETSNLPSSRSVGNMMEGSKFGDSNDVEGSGSDPELQIWYGDEATPGEFPFMVNTYICYCVNFYLPYFRWSQRFNLYLIVKTCHWGWLISNFRLEYKWARRSTRPAAEQDTACVEDLSSLLE